MAVATSLLKSEMRRHLLMNVGLVASCVVGGTVVTNERGLFVPLGIHGMSETAKAFAAMFTPSHLMPGFTNVQMIAPLEPFDVTADSRDLRRRLMDAFSDFSAPAAGVADPSQDIAQYSGDQTLTPMELAQNDATGGIAPTSGGSGSGSGSNSSSSSSTPASAAAASTAAADSGSTSQGGQSSTSTGNTASTGTSSPLSRSTGDLLTSSQTQANSETNAGGTTDVVTPPVVTPPDNTAPVPEPSVWAMMVAGFGAIGYMIRSSARRRREAEEDALLFGEDADFA